MKKTLFALAGALALSAMVIGCGGSKTAENGVEELAISTAAKSEGNIKKIRPKETVTLDVYSQLANYSGMQTGWFADLMLAKFNVKINIIPDTGGAYQTRMEAGNLGDIVVWGDNTDKYSAACKKGMLLDWEEDNMIAQWAPYINNNMKLALQKNKFMDSPDKKLHGYGYNVSTSAKDIQEFFYTWDLRFDLYEQIGKPEIKTLDDMVDVLAKMKEVCPTDDNGKPTYGVSLFNDWDGNMVMYVKSLATAYFGYDEFDFGLFDPDEGKFYDCLGENSPYLYCLKFINKLNQKGLVDPDSMTQKYGGMSEDYQNGTAFWNIFNWMASGAYNTDAHVKEAGKAMYPVLPKDAHPIVYGQSVYGGTRLWTIGAKTAYPELCMAIINWFSTPEGYMTILYGPRGLCWDIKDGKTYFTDLGKKAQADQNNTEMPAPYKGSFHDGAFQINNTTWCADSLNPLTKNETYNKTSWESEQLPAQSEIEQRWRDWAGATTPNRYMQKSNYRVSPGSLFTGAGVPDDLTMKWNQVAECIKNETWNAIYAKTDAEYDAIVAKMVSDAKSYGYDDCIAHSLKQAEKRAAAEKLAKAQ
jgi:multiple sugar transport system substrate-binding protein/putative aldouronate transport system substrate-binding protein